MFESFDTKEFGNYTKQFRESLKITQQSVSDLTGLSLEAIRKLEKGISIPRYDTLELLSKVYKVDMLYVFSQYRSSSELYDFYNNLDHLILEHDQVMLSRLIDLFKEKISAESKSKIFDQKELKQFVLILKGIELYNTNKHINTGIDLFLEAIRLTIPNFEIKSFKSFKYTQLELRILTLIGLSITVDRSYDLAIEIFMKTLETLKLKHRLDLNDIKMMSKLYFNISYDYYYFDDHKNAILYAKEGIKHNRKYHSTYALSGLYYRLGISKYLTGDKTYMDDLRLSIYTLKINGHEKLAQIYIDQTLKTHGIKIY